MVRGGVEMKLGLINSAFSQVGMDFEEGIRHAKEIGFDTIDVFTEAWQISGAEKRLIAEVCTANDLPIISLPVCALGIADFNEPVRRFHIDRTKAFVDLASELRAKNVLYVMGEYLWQQEVIPPQDQWSWAVEGTCEIGEYAAENGVEIVVELEPFKLSIVNNIEKMVRFLKDVNSPAVFANIDVSHVVLGGDTPADIASLKGLAQHVHLSDCDGRVHGDLPPGDGVIDFIPYLQAIKDLDMKGVVSIELEYSPEPARIVEWVRDAYESTASLMREVGLRE
jgi:D-psicose/D-tagatose/L-ribulose 3-epimerase